MVSAMDDSQVLMRSDALLRWNEFAAIVFLTLVLSSAAGAQATTDVPPRLQAAGAEAFASIVRFYDYDDSIPLSSRVVERTDNGNSVREKFIIRGVRGFWVPGFLEIPKQRGQRAVPTILMLHGWSGSKESWWKDGGYISGGNMRRALLDAGYAVVALDAPTHGDRIAENDYALVNPLTENGRPVEPNHFTLAEIVMQSTRDYRRVLDYLASHAAIDAHRIGMVGYSMGGVQAFILSSVEPRIKVAVSCVPPSMANERTSIAPSDYARGIGDRAFLMLMGRRDSMCHPHHAQELFEMIPSRKKDLKFFDAEHKLPASYVRDALDWFEVHLKQIGS